MKTKIINISATFRNRFSIVKGSGNERFKHIPAILLMVLSLSLLSACTDFLTEDLKGNFLRTLSIKTTNKPFRR
jgi:hypothetical protein